MSSNYRTRLGKVMGGPKDGALSMTGTWDGLAVTTAHGERYLEYGAVFVHRSLWGAIEGGQLRAKVGA